jgi:hypothetical protein
MSMMNNARGTSCARKVKICKKKAVTKNTVISMSTGDEAGSMMGVVSNKIKDSTQFRTGSMKVKVEGHPLVHLTCLTGQNGNNANMPAGCHVAPSQVKVLVSP